MMSMTTAAGYFDRKPSSSIRPGLSHLQADPSSPHTPQRTFSSAFSSPSISYRNEEEALIFDFGSRHFSAGFAGEAASRCTLGFGPEESRRVGDYRQWLPDYKKIIRRQSEDNWGRNHELWRMDLREVDLGLVEDKIERAVREACNKYLLLDVKSRRILLVLPSVLPHALLSSILSTIFINFQHPSITLFPSPIVHTAAAGCRSSLVVDIGWSETIVTAIYEYREIHQSRTTRAMKRITLDMVKMLRTYEQKLASTERQVEDEEETTIEADFDTAEDITTRMAWCPSLKDSQRTNAQQNPTHQLSDLSIAEDPPSPPPTDPLNTIPSPFNPASTLTIPFSSFATPTESALLASSLPRHSLDDHEQALQTLLFRTLLALPPDVRAVCMSHIILTGGGSQIPGLKTRLLEELTTTIETRGWNAVTGQAADERRKRLKAISGNRDRNQNQNLPPGPNERQQQRAETEAAKQQQSPLPASLQPQIHDPIEEKLRQAAMKGAKATVSGVVRGVESLGAWAGGSLVAALKIKGVVEVERDGFLATGLAGAGRREREREKGVGGGEKGGWTLGGWA